MENFLGKNGFVWWTGVVEDRLDPLNLGRCRVRIFGWHTADKMAMPTATLPWALPKLPVNNSKTFTTPAEGEWVTGFFFDGESGQFPVYDGVLPGIAKGATNPQTGFADPRTDAQLTASPAFPAKTVIPTDGSGAETNNQPAPRNPIDVGFPSTNKLAINDTTNQASQIVSRAFATTQNIAGPEAKTLGTAIAGAAQGAAQVLQGIQPDLEKLVPKASELANSIEPSMNSLTKSLQSSGGGIPSLSGLLSGAAPSLNSAIGSLGGPEAQAKFQKDLATAQKNMASAETSVSEQIAKAQKAASEAAEKAKAALEKDLPTLQAESKNIAGSISDKLKELSAGNVSTKTPVILSPATIGSITAATTSFESGLYKNTPDDRLTYSGMDYIIWDRTNAERLRRKLPSLTEIGSPRPPEDAPAQVPKANLGAVAPAPLVATLAPNKIPDQVPLEKTPSTQKKSFENSLDLFGKMVEEDTSTLLAQLPSVTNRATLLVFFEKQTALTAKWNSMADEIQSALTGDDKQKAFTSTYSTKNKAIRNIKKATDARIEVLNAQG